VLAVAMMLVAPAAMAARGDREAAAEPARSAPVVRNTVDELKQLMDSRQLTELRTTYNGNYGASLLFNANTLTYYVALFQEKNFWRVIKTDAVDNAERVYRTFAQQSEQLAQVYIDTTRLEAGKRYTERLVAYNEERLRTLRRKWNSSRRSRRRSAPPCSRPSSRQSASAPTCRAPTASWTPCSAASRSCRPNRATRS
jgi:hypothetical protein